MRRPIVGVMGSGLEENAELAGPLGRLIARLDCHLLTGGGAGSMLAVSRAFTSVAPRVGLCIGILPMDRRGGTFVTRRGYPNRYVEIAIQPPLGAFDPNEPDTPSRNWVNTLSSDAVVALPGRLGTKNEVELALRFGKPLLLYGPRAAFASFPAAAHTDSLETVETFLLGLAHPK